LALCAPVTAGATDVENSAKRCEGMHSILRNPNAECQETARKRANAPAGSATGNSDALDTGWLRAEMAAFAIIGVAQVRGGTDLLRDVWYAGAVLVPPFMPTDAEYGLRKNYLAVTPPFIALGVINDYLHRDRANDSRIFLTNFIAFNVGMLWSRNVTNNPGHFLEKSSTRLTWQPTIDGDNRYGIVTLRANW
jgi:hypothetical protein